MLKECSMVLFIFKRPMKNDRWIIYLIVVKYRDNSRSHMAFIWQFRVITSHDKSVETLNTIYKFVAGNHRNVHSNFSKFVTLACRIYITVMNKQYDSSTILFDNWRLISIYLDHKRFRYFASDLKLASKSMVEYGV